ncbi:hypothetical protein MRX96_010932 [Rhipicephalus microplus]
MDRVQPTGRRSVSSVVATGSFTFPPVEPATSADIRSLCEDVGTGSPQEAQAQRSWSADRITHQMPRNLDASKHLFVLGAFNSFPPVLSSWISDTPLL